MPNDTIIKALFPFWAPGMSGFIDSKVKEFVQYQ